MNMQGSADPALVFSLNAYRLLLLAYPRAFREEYGAHMLQVFGDRCRQRLGEAGKGGLVLWWLIALIDFGQSVIAQHLRKETDMATPGYIRAGGWAFIFGAIAHLGFWISAAALMSPGGGSPDWYRTIGFLSLSTLLISVGSLALRETYGSRVGSAGRKLLAAGAGASVAAYAVLLDPIWELGFPFWAIPFLGASALLASLALFGALATRSGALPKSVGLPLLGCAWFLLLLIPVLVFESRSDTFDPDFVRALGWGGSIVTSFALVRLGWLLQSRAIREPSAA